MLGGAKPPCRRHISGRKKADGMVNGRFVSYLQHRVERLLGREGPDGMVDGWFVSYLLA